ncbi:hypothetical protein IC611_17520 [Proteus mirabilis]
MQALSVSFPDMAYCGPPVLLATVGSSGLIAMVVGNLISHGNYFTFYYHDH